MFHYNEQELKQILPQFFLAPVEITEIHFCPTNEDTGYTEDIIAFKIQIPEEHASFTEITHKEVLIYRVDWEELILLCHITVSDYEKLRPLKYNTEALIINEEIVTLNNGTKAIRTIENRNGRLVEVIDSLKPIPKTSTSQPDG